MGTASSQRQASTLVPAVNLFAWRWHPHWKGSTCSRGDNAEADRLACVPPAAQVLMGHCKQEQGRPGSNQHRTKQQRSAYIAFGLRVPHQHDAARQQRVVPRAPAGRQITGQGQRCWEARAQWQLWQRKTWLELSRCRQPSLTSWSSGCWVQCLCTCLRSGSTVVVVQAQAAVVLVASASASAAHAATSAMCRQQQASTHLGPFGP